MAETTYGYAVDGAGGSDHGGHGTLSEVQALARHIIDGGQGEMAVWPGNGPMTFPVTRMRYDDENEWAEVWQTTGPQTEVSMRQCARREGAVEHLTELLTGTHAT